jgi:hypothetical protein
MFTLSMLKNRAAVVVAALTFALVSPALKAQSMPQRMQVIVPFGFEAGAAHFSPGRYILSTQGEDLLLIQDSNRSALTMSRNEDSQKPATKSMVIFHRYGNHYFLSEIWRKGEAEHVRCAESKAERRISREVNADQRASLVPHADVEVAVLELPR